MSFSVNILGCGSATPTLRHHPSAQIVDHEGRMFMVDCGEGTQLQMRRMHLPFSRVKHIFISHLHGDHMLGLPGLLSTLSLHDIEGQVHVYMFPDGIGWLKEYMRISNHYTTLEVVYHPVSRTKAVVYEDKKLTVETFPLWHTVECVGYIFREKPAKRILRGDLADHYGIPVALRPGIKEGDDYTTEEGVVIPNKALTLDPPPPASYAYCSDTAYTSNLKEFVRGVDLLYHEATYGDEKLDKAKARGHSTARQAAQVALESEAKRLVLGHFSKSYDSEEPLLAQAREVFPNTIAANEGMNIPVK